MSNSGHHTIITYTVTEQVWLPEPHGQCIDGATKRTGEFCEFTCVTEYIEDICGCTDIHQGRFCHSSNVTFFYIQHTPHICKI